MALVFVVYHCTLLVVVNTATKSRSGRSLVLEVFFDDVAGVCGQGEILEDAET
jgi:hypothetical protein